MFGCAALRAEREVVHAKAVQLRLALSGRGEPHKQMGEFVEALSVGPGRVVLGGTPRWIHPECGAPARGQRGGGTEKGTGGR